MTWTTPEVTRVERKSVADERAAIEAALDHQRSTFLFKCGGLTAEQLTLRSVGRSSLSLLGIARHLADCERWWFRRRFAGDTSLTTHIFFTEDNMEGDFLDGTAQSAAADLETYRAEVAAARAVTTGRSLDDTFPRKDGQVADLRWLFFHMIEEYARHNGHADLLREHVDGATGE